MSVSLFLLSILSLTLPTAWAEDHVLAGDPVCYYNVTGCNNASQYNVSGFPCFPDEPNRLCITLAQRCDGYNDCGNNSDEKKCDSSSSLLGYFAAAVAALFFGSNFVPVKKFETGDGMFFQWVLCTGIWSVGIVVNLIKGQVPFQPYAVLGGVSWATGNLTVVPIVKAIGLAQGLLVWGSINMIMGWAAARFGWFGIIAQVPSNSTLQIGGILCAVVSTLLYALVKPNIKPVSDETTPLMSLQDEEKAALSSQSLSWVERFPPSQRRLIGLGMSVAGGMCYSLTFDPSQYWMDNKQGASQDALNYAFSQYCGIFMASTFYFLLYCCYQRNSPVVYPKVILPGFISGIMWAIAQTAWFMANQRLSQAVSYPIVTTLPGIIATLWGVLVFREIRGLRNYCILGMAYSITFAGVTMVVVSQ